MRERAIGPVVAVGGVVIAPGPRVLLVKRKKPPMLGMWTLPGGRLLPGEAIARGVEREVLEETGIRVSSGDLIEIVEINAEGYSYVIHDHLCTPHDPDAAPIAGDDAAEARYFAPGDVSHLGVTQAVSRVIQKGIAMRQAPNEDE